MHLRMHTVYFTTVLITIFGFGKTDNKINLLGCYIKTYNNMTMVSEVPNFNQCLTLCNDRYYRYAYYYTTSKCYCGNYLGEQQSSGTCETCDTCVPKEEVADVYKTQIYVNGPPRNVIVENATASEADISWMEPESFTALQSYKVVAAVTNTFSTNKLTDLVWLYSNNTYKVHLLNLHPGTQYNISVQTVLDREEGVAAFAEIYTTIADPDQIPEAPEIVSKDDTHMRIQLKPVINNNGPVTAYQVIVIDASSVQAVQNESLKGYQQATTEGLPYYIAAEINPEKASKIFTIGDGQYYNGYYNAPLKADEEYNTMGVVVSRFRSIEKKAFGIMTSSKIDVLVVQMDTGSDEATPALIVALTIGIVVISCLLVAGLIAFYFLRNRIENRHRQRLNDNQELALQGPMIDIENSGYVHDEDEPASHYYNNFKAQVWMIAQNDLKVDDSTLLGTGQFGEVYSGVVKKNADVFPVAVCSISDRALSHSNKRLMLKDLDILIKLNNCPNVVQLVGTHEDVDTIMVVMENAPINLKDLLLNSRLSGADKLTNLLESQLTEFASNIATGMKYLHLKNILHRQLCARNVTVNGTTAKVSGIGLTKYYSNDYTPYFKRFTSREVLKGQPHGKKSDIWAYACTLWEMSALGGTLYGSISTAELPEKIIRGVSLLQLPYVYDSFYQIMLNCWQLDLDERPSFAELEETFADGTRESYLNLEYSAGVRLEPYYSELEIT